MQTIAPSVLFPVFHPPYPQGAGTAIGIELRNFSQTFFFETLQGEEVQITTKHSWRLSEDCKSMIRGAPPSDGSYMKNQHFFQISKKSQSVINLLSSEYQPFVNIIEHHQNISNMSMKNKRMSLFHQSEKHELKKISLIHQYKVIIDEALMFRIIK